MEVVGVDDAGRTVEGNDDQFQQSPTRQGSDDQPTVFAIVEVLTPPDGVLPSVEEFIVGEPALAGVGGDLHSVKTIFTHRQTRR